MGIESVLSISTEARLGNRVKGIFLCPFEPVMNGRVLAKIAAHAGQGLVETDEQKAASHGAQRKPFETLDWIIGKMLQGRNHELQCQGAQQRLHQDICC